jgi:hypothetical protein
VYLPPHAQIIELVAGSVGERLFLGNSGPGSSADYAKAQAYVRLICKSKRGAALYVEAREAEAEHLLDQYRHIVKQLAEQLLIRRTLTGLEIDRCIAEAVDQRAMEDEWDRRAQWKEIVAANAGSASSTTRASKNSPRLIVSRKIEP